MHARIDLIFRVETLGKIEYVLRMTAIRCILIFVFLVGLNACTTNPVTGKSEMGFVSESEEIRMGTEAYPFYLQMQGGVYQGDPELAAYVRNIGNKIADVSDRPHLPYEFVILNSSDMNAWALPGGKIALNRGLLLEMDNEGELAAVIAHEIVHAAGRHSAKQMERSSIMNIGVAGVAAAAGQDYQLAAGQMAGLGAGLLQAGYSREHETEADVYSIKYMSKAGYNPIGAVTLQKKFLDKFGGGSGGWFATHPGSDDRLDVNKEHIKKFPTEGYIGETEYRVKTSRLRKQAPAYALYDKGVEAFHKKDLQAAHVFAKEAIKYYPDEALFFVLKAQVEGSAGKLQAAEKTLTQAITLNSNYFASYLYRAMVREKMGKNVEALEDYRVSYRLLPTEEAKKRLQRLQ